MSSVAIRCKDLVRAFGEQRALDGVTMAAPAGNLTAIVGPSGSGKTTLLRIVAGLEAADAGEVRLGERVVSAPAPTVPARERGIGMVFQSLGLWPHFTVERHLRFVFNARGVEPAEQPRQIQELLELVGLGSRASAAPAELSGGEQQRVALARALAGDPSVLLLDEPFGSLDASLRLHLRTAVRDIQRKLGLTTVLVTHDQEEALAVADHLVVMHRGRVEQAGLPTEVYRRPASRFVAEFLGGAVVVDGTVKAGPGNRRRAGRASLRRRGVTLEGARPRATRRWGSSSTWHADSRPPRERRGGEKKPPLSIR